MMKAETLGRFQTEADGPEVGSSRLRRRELDGSSLGWRHWQRRNQGGFGSPPPPLEGSYWIFFVFDFFFANQAHLKIVDQMR